MDKRTLILGGTFDPVHNGHVYIAENAAEFVDADKILLIPNFVPPHKLLNHQASAEDRFNMCCLAVKDKPLFFVDDIEIKRGGKSYTYETVEALASKYPGEKLYLLMGADMFLTFHQWKHPKRILSKAFLVVVSREELEYRHLQEYVKKNGYNSQEVFIKNLKPVHISSTLVRNNIKQGISCENLLHADVLEYIKENNLYL